jgi:hypothetical protein
MATSARTKHRPATGRVATAVVADAVGTWVIPTALGAIAVLAAASAGVGLLAPEVGLAIAIVAGLGLVAERALTTAVASVTPGTAIAVAIGLVWIALCYVPFHFLLFPGAPLHEPIALHGADATLPVKIPTGGHRSVDLMLEAQLPPNPGSETAIPVSYTVTVDDTAQARTVLSGRFEESLSTRRLGRRGTAKVVHAHHAERRLVSNPTGGDVTISAVTLEPSTGATMTVTAYPHRLPSAVVLAVLAVVVLAAVVAIDARIVPASEGVLTYATPAVLGAALALWTSNTVHPTLSSLVGSLIFGGPLGLGLGALLWAIARRTLVQPGR